MRKLKLYLDTSVLNILFAEDVPEFKKITEEFFEIVKIGKRFEVYISDVVINEIIKTNDIIKRNSLLSIIEDYHLIRLPNDKDVEISKLAEVYINKGIIPKVKIEDALHIAYAVVLENGYNYPIRIITPMEVDYEDDNDF